MRRTISLIGAPLILCLLVGSKSKEPDYSKLLPGVTKVNTNLYYDITEVTNLNWVEYLHDLSTKHGKTSPEYMAALPDTSKWRAALTYQEPYRVYYLRHPAYHNYPVVGVSWMQAAGYCDWRTKKVKEFLEADGKLDQAPEYFQYRLPLYEEWQLMMSDLSNLADTIGEEGKRKYCGLYRWNMKKRGQDNMGVAGQINDAADITAPVFSYWPNQYGVYNIKGNVSEWIADESAHVGGAWNTHFDEDILQKTPMEGSSAYVGFRCVCEVLEETDF